jgi:O-antigen/teichoic acid export membrane protein
MHRFDLLFATNVVFAGITVVGALIVPLGADPKYIFGLMAIGCFGASLAGQVVVVLPKLSKPVAMSVVDWHGISGYAINMWIYTLLASLVWSRGEFPLIKAMLGDSAVAHYAAALVIYGAAVQGIMIGVSGIAPHLTSLWGRGEKLKAIGLARNIMDLQLALCGIGSLVVIVFGSTIISIAFSPAYQEAAKPLSILCLGLTSFVLSSQAHLVQLDTNGRFSRNSIVVGLVILYVLAVLLIPGFELLGAAIARVGAVLAIAISTAIFATLRWGTGSVSVRNSVFTLGILVVSAIVERRLDITALFERFLLLSLGVTTTFLLLRSSKGEMVILNLFRNVWSRRG